MATPIPKKYFQLVNDTGQNPLDIVFGDSNPTTDVWAYCDWDLGGNGNIRVISRQDAVVQNTLKNVFTEKQPTGYGTNIYSLIGEKDVVVRRASLFMDITMAIVAQKLFSDAQAASQNLSPDDLITTVSKLVVVENPDDPSRSIVQMSLVTNSSTTIDVNVL